MLLGLAAHRRGEVGVRILPTGAAVAAIVGRGLCNFAAMAALPWIVRHLGGDAPQKLKIFRVVPAENQLQLLEMRLGQSHNSTSVEVPGEPCFGSLPPQGTSRRRLDGVQVKSKAKTRETYALPDKSMTKERIRW